MAKNTKIGVVVRMRPLLPSQHQSPSTKIQTEPSTSSILYNLNRLLSQDPRTQKRFYFDKVFQPSTSQSDLFKDCKIQHLVSQALAGYNGTIFAYGQTGSGKTFTMEGYKYDKNLKPILSETQTGIIPRAIHSLFDQISNSPPSIEYSVYCSFMQIYNEQIFDLLSPQKQSLRMRWNKKEEFYVQKLSLHPCSSPQQVLGYFHMGLKNKVMGSHNLNQSSSRSHCVLGLVIEALNSETGAVLKSKFQMVDLAGSERTAQTGNEGVSMKESIEINKSLFTLRQVITSLASDKEAGFVPYRDSKLTSLLKHSIGGNSFCLMVACLAPLDAFFQENLSTLTYATQTSCITNEPVKNIDSKTKMMKALKKEIKTLKQELAAANQQIASLSELLKQTEFEKGKKKFEGSAQVQRVLSIRSPKKKIPTIPSKRGKTAQNFMNSDLLTEKLRDSVQIIKELMASNQKLKESFKSVQLLNKTYQAELSQLQFQNFQLSEKLEKIEFRNLDSPKFSQEKNELQKRIQQIQNQNRQIQNFFFQTYQPKAKQEWG